jgi:hypothetical protein
MTTKKGDAMKKLIITIVTCFAALWAVTAAEAAIVVGRISHVEGDIYRYMDVDDSWVATQLQSPAGTEDVIATGPDSRADIRFPNGMLVRLDENAEIEILELEEELGAFVLSAGLARFYNRSGSGKLVIETARGTATVATGSVMDMRADGRNIVISAVTGEGTFQSVQNGLERLEVLSGSTSLEFREESLVAGTGPINWNWNAWCGAREGAWAQNRLVRSDYLPDSMQEYAYEIEPYGSWNRVYYRGYYYWAWKPHYVAAGWSPYTSGYWYDWHGSPVWMDHNPWGWVTHHHGHWIAMNGSWLWTPYVHVSPVPGVTVVGFNIAFGRTYRSHWHPGRVRWISHNDYIGWFPLAPWETYYGYRGWGPGTVLVHGGPGISLSINLSQHKHIDHAIIIPNRHLHRKGPVEVNDYNTVKIANINKRIIVKDYKPLLTAERERARMHRVVKSGPGIKAAGRTTWSQFDKKKTRAGEMVRQTRPEKKDVRVTRTQQVVPKERTVQGSMQRSSEKEVTKKQTKVVERNRKYTAARTAQRKVSKIEQRGPRAQIQKQENPLQRKNLTARVSPEKAVEKKTVRLEQQVPVPKIQKQVKPLQRKNLTARVPSPQRSRVAREGRVQKQTRESPQAGTKTGSRSKVVQNNTAAAGRNDTGKGKKVQREVTTQAQRQAALNDRKFPVSREREEKKTPQQKVRNENNASERNGFQERNGTGQTGSRNWFSTSMNNRRVQ